MRRSTRLLSMFGVMAMTAGLWVAPPAAVAQGAGESFLVVKADDLPSNAELAVRMSEITPLNNPRRVVISRDDEFADALASGVIQSESPLLLVPRNGPVPTRVMDEIRRLGVREATILGGDQAVSPAVQQELGTAGLTVDRRQGASRFETAVEIARREVPDATTAILARAFTANPADPTQGFADALGAGAMAAENRWPILLTSTSTLSPQTRTYLADSQVEEIKIVGGTAAVSAEVEAELQAMGMRTQRMAGDSRAGTAVEIAKNQGADSAADVSRVVLVDGTSPNGFAGGFAAAGHSALFDAPVLLTDGIMVPPETNLFLQPGAAFAQAGSPVAVTCVVHPLACDSGREALGLVDYPLLDVAPPINSLVNPGQQIQVQLTPADEGAFTPVTVKGSCVGAQIDTSTDANGMASFSLTSTPPPFSTCNVDVTYGQVGEQVSQGFSYALTADAARGPNVNISSTIFSYGVTATTTPLYVSDRLECTGPTGSNAQEDATYLGRYVYPDFFVQSFGLTSFPLEVQPGQSCTATAQVPEGVSRVLWGVYAWSDAGLRNPLKLGRGTVATFNFDDIGSLADVNVVWILETNAPEIGVPTPPAEGTQGQVFNPEALDIRCDGVLIDPDLSFQVPGTSCEVLGAPAGRSIVVVEAGRPITPVATATFTAPTSGFTTAVYTVVNDREANAGGQGGAAGCVGAPDLPYSEVSPGVTSPSSPSAYRNFFAFADESLRFRADAAFGNVEGALDTVLNLYAPDGSLLASNDDGDSGLNSRIDAVIPEEGIYCLEVSGYAGTTGDFLLIADPAPVFTDSGQLTTDAPTASYDFSGTEGTPLVVEMRVPGFDATDPYLEMYDANNNLVAFDDDGGGFPNARMQLLIPATGDYTIVARVFGDNFGPYLLEASFPTGPVAGAPAAFAAAG